MNSIIQMLINSKKFEGVIKEIKNYKGPVTLTGLTDVFKVCLTYGIKENLNKKICLVTYNEIQAKKLLKDIEYFTSKVVFLPKKEIVTYDYVAESKDLPYERIDALNKIYTNNVDIVITTIEALIQKSIPKDTLYKDILKFETGKVYNLDNIKRSLVNLGYMRCELIEGRGQFSIRGGIIDISITDKKGARIEFWGDEVDSIRYFNIINQRSTEMIDNVTIYPSHEFVLEKDLEQVCNNIQRQDIEFEDIVLQDIELIKSGNYISKIDKYFNCFYENTTNMLDYMAKDFLMVLDEESKIQARFQNLKIDNQNVIKMLIEKQKIVPDAMKNVFDNEDIMDNILKRQTIYLEKQDIDTGKRENLVRFETREINYYKSSMELFLEELQSGIHGKKTIVLLAGNENNSRKLSLLLLEKNIPHKYIEKLDKNIQSGIAIVSTGVLSTGFESYDLNTLVISSEELFNKDIKKKRKTNTAFTQGEKVIFADLKIGDYVVHKTHGIGQFIGVNTIKADGITKDYIKIKYNADDILYIPTNQLDNIRKYIGEGDSIPKLSKLGSKEWANTKAKVKSNLREVAKELIELYAKRQKATGFAFSEDSPWQTQFEESFPYVETDDQLRCIEEVKKDMQQAKPMDRLLCGDVGYGKTEVAIRAAFKACMDQKQVAYLVPTTVLANQQYEGFKQRMEEFAIKVELLNRFKTKKEQDNIIKKLKLGEVDVVIGTHRILSKDIGFKDLGLLIIDEEHRFGVKAKEKIKELKTSIDVLTMTATPIPRTLHMSIVGVRDMSVIYEPPQNRRPVQTYVLEYDKEVVKEAITKELERGGQAI